MRAAASRETSRFPDGGRKLAIQAIQWSKGLGRWWLGLVDMIQPYAATHPAAITKNAMYATLPISVTAMTSIDSPCLR